MNEYMIDAEFDRLWNLCQECVQKARALTVAGEQRDQFTRIAMVGFSYKACTSLNTEVEAVFSSELSNFSVVVSQDDFARYNSPIMPTTHAWSGVA